MSTTENALRAPDLERVIAVTWLAGSLFCFVWLFTGLQRVARVSKSCRTSRLNGESVLISDGVGPAVLGVLRHRIVIPTWVEELDEDEQRLILAHEREHVSARDPLIVHAMMLVVALMPWNIAFWFALHRLRAAIEIDCDARVLRGRRPVTRDYCRLLLKVGERTVAPAAPLLALAEPATLLERRIESMTTTRKLRDRKTLLSAAGAVLLFAGACRTPRPEIAPFRRSGETMHAVSSTTAAGSGRTSSGAAPVRIAKDNPAPPAVAQPDIPVSQASASASRSTIGSRAPVALSAVASGTDTTIHNEEALRRSAEEHQAHVDALADSVILASYPELTRRPPGSPAFLALVLDDRGRVMRHAVSLDPALPNDLAAIMLALRVDTISGRTIGLGISGNNRWHVTVGHAVEALGPVRGKTEMRAYIASTRPYSLQRVPYERIVDSVARARSPAAYQDHEGSFAIAMLLDEAGNVTRYGAEPRADASVDRERPTALMNRLLGDSSRAGDMTGVIGRLVPARTVIVWGVKR